MQQSLTTTACNLLCKFAHFLSRTWPYWSSSQSLVSLILSLLQILKWEMLLRWEYQESDITFFHHYCCSL